MNQLSPVRDDQAVDLSGVHPADNEMRRVISAGLLATLVLLTLQAAGQAIDFGVYNLRIWLLNCDKHYSLFGVVSLLAQATFGALCLWRGRYATRDRWAWLLLGALMGVLVLIRGLTSFNATLLALPLLCVFGLVCWLTWGDPGSARAVVWGGLFLMAISLLLHKVGLAADASTATDFTWTYQIEGMVKHGAELAGWMMLSTGVLAGVVDRLPSNAVPGNIAIGADAVRRYLPGTSSRRPAQRNRA